MTKTSVTGQDIRDGGLTDADVATANKDGVAATPSMRTLGTGALQGAPGCDLTTVASLGAGPYNNWSPTSLASAGYIDIDTGNANPTITGIDATGAVQGRRLKLTLMDGGYLTGLTLSHMSASSTAANRFVCPGAKDYHIPPGGGVVLEYGSTVGYGYWRVLASIPAELPQNFSTPGLITPAALTGNTNNWIPTGLATCSVIFVDATGSYNLTGLAAQPDGTRIRLIMSPNGNTTLVINSGSSSAGNQFIAASVVNVVLRGLGSVDLIHWNGYWWVLGA